MAIYSQDLLKVNSADVGAYGVIYCITNKSSGKRYIGQTTDTAHARWLAHTELSNYIRNRMYIAAAIQAHGKDQFNIEVVCTASNKKQLDKYESYLIRKFNTLDTKFGYNLKSGGANGTHSQSTKDKISLTKKSQKLKGSELQRKRVSEVNSRPKTKEHVEKVRLAHLGKKRSIETCLKLKKVKAELFGKSIIAINLDNNVEYKFDSIRECSRQLNLTSRGFITNILNGKYKKYKNWTFRRAV